jgi:hypothetical protein
LFQIKTEISGEESKPLTSLKGLDFLSIKVNVNQYTLDLSVQEFKLESSHHSESRVIAFHELIVDLKLEITIVLGDTCSHLGFLLHYVIGHRANHASQVRCVFLFHFVKQGHIYVVRIAFREELIDV